MLTCKHDTLHVQNMLLCCKHAQFQLSTFRHPTHPVIVYMGMGGGLKWLCCSKVALFTCTVFHRNLFQLEYYMSVRYKRADIKISENKFTSIWLVLLALHIQMAVQQANHHCYTTFCTVIPVNSRKRLLNSDKNRTPCCTSTFLNQE